MKTHLTRAVLTKYYVTFIRAVLEYGCVAFDDTVVTMTPTIWNKSKGDLHYSASAAQTHVI